MELVDPV